MLMLLSYGFEHLNNYGISDKLMKSLNLKMESFTILLI